MLATFDLPVGLSNYQTQEDPDAYDDERTHTLYSYFLSLRLGDAERRFDVPYKRIYKWHHKCLLAFQQWLKLPPEQLLEIHISENDGRRDIHSRITQQTWWVWQIAQFPMVVPFVLESRLNRLSVPVVPQEYDRIAALISTQDLRVLNV